VTNRQSAYFYVHLSTPCKSATRSQRLPDQSSQIFIRCRGIIGGVRCRVPAERKHKDGVRQFSPTRATNRLP